MLIFTQHALSKLKQRGIPKVFVAATLRNPDVKSKGYSNRKVAYKKFGKFYLKVIFRSEDNDAIVITQYWTEIIK